MAEKIFHEYVQDPVSKKLVQTGGGGGITDAGELISADTGNAIVKGADDLLFVPELPTLGTMAEKDASDYRTATQQDSIDNTKIDTLTAGANVTITGTGKSRTISVTGIELPDKFTSTENGSGAAGVSNTYNLLLVEAIDGTPVFNTGDVVIFANGYNAEVTSVNTGANTYTATTILQPQAVAWGGIGGSLANQADLKAELDKRLEVENQVRVINLVGGAATVGYEIIPFVDYVFIANTNITSINITDTVGSKNSATKCITNNATIEDSGTIPLNSPIKLYWSGVYWILSTAKFTKTVDNIASASVYDAATLRLLKEVRDALVTKEAGKGLSEENYTSIEKTKLSGIQAGAQVNPTNVSALTNDSGYVTAAAITTHNTDSVAHSDIRTAVATADAIARGKSRARVFNTKADLDTWLLTPANVAELQIGDNFYIKAIDVPDYWWDGTQTQALEGEKVDLTDYYTKTQADGRYVQIVSGKGLSTNDFDNDSKSFTDFMRGTQTVTSLTNVPTSAHTVYANISANQSLTMASLPALPSGWEVYICAVNAGAAAYTLAIPDSGDYVSMSGTSVGLPVGGRVEISVKRDQNAAKYTVAVLEKS